MSKPSAHAIRAGQDCVDWLHPGAKDGNAERYKRRCHEASIIVESEAIAPAVAEATRPLVEALARMEARFLVSIRAGKACADTLFSGEKDRCTLQADYEQVRTALAPYRQGRDA